MREETDWLGSDQFLPDGKFPSDSSKIKPPKGDWEKLRILQSFLKYFEALGVGVPGAGPETPEDVQEEPEVEPLLGTDIEI